MLITVADLQLDPVEFDERFSVDAKQPDSPNRAWKCTLVTVNRRQFSGYNGNVMSSRNTSWFAFSGPERSQACWVNFLVCPRRYLAVLPSHARANLFAGD